jgi:hypothetical protein
MESPEKPIFDSREDAHVPFEAHGSEALEAELKEAAAGEHHNSNLFDLDETLHGGEKTDLANGKRIDNSTDHGLDNLTVHDDIPSDTKDDEDDAAARWLRENDPKLKN